MIFRPFTDFYDQIGFAPTSTTGHRKNAKLNRLKTQLYENLGINHSLLKYLDILEIGPGSGENLQRLITFSPKSLTILDGSSAVINNLRHKILQSKSTKIKFITADALTFKSNKQYDLIIAEGILPFQLFPRKMLLNIAKLLKVNGSIIITTADEFSIFSEVCRRYIGKRVYKDLKYSKDKVKLLVNFFQKDFSSLPGMTRNFDDWIVDSIINPWGGELFSIKDALTISNLKLQESSPRIFYDWRWYKDPSFLQDKNINLKEIDTYSKNCLNLFDRRFEVNTIDVESYKAISKVLMDFYYNIRDHMFGEKEISKNNFEDTIMNLLYFSNMFHPETRKSLKALIQWSKTDDLEKLDDFRSLWGRGQQFLHLRKIK
jgi:2-polyprenyl-3-methyl-5-hydroxy-6-metoxy-1,4-benzoquinol methylase